MEQWLRDAKDAYPWDYPFQSGAPPKDKPETVEEALRKAREDGENEGFHYLRRE